MKNAASSGSPAVSGRSIRSMGNNLRPQIPQIDRVRLPICVHLRNLRMISLL
ncbi:MAG TPA: hypothetical protein VF593_14195 [Chthoniobacteraceae bacterium]